MSSLARQFARWGGLQKSLKKAAACRRNGKLGGRPRKNKQSPRQRQKPRSITRSST